MNWIILDRVNGPTERPGLEEPSVLLPRGALKQPPEVEERIFRLITQEVPQPRATVIPRSFEAGPGSWIDGDGTWQEYDKIWEDYGG